MIFSQFRGQQMSKILPAWPRRAIVALMFVLLACGSAMADQPPLQSSEKTVLKPNVRVLPSDGSVVVSNVTPTSVTLTGNVPALVPGTVFGGGKLADGSPAS